MDAVELEERYLKVSKRCFMIGGIWPTQKKCSQYIGRAIIFIIMGSCILTQIARVVWFFDIPTLLQQLSFLLAMSLLLVKHAVFITNDSKFKALLDGMYSDWGKDKTREELSIMISYMERGALIATIYAFAYLSLMVFIQMPWWPRIADILMPLNTSRPRGYIYPNYYFVDHDKYYYWIIAHMTSGAIICVFGYVACDIYFIYTVQHACGLFAVAGHRFKEAIHPISDGRKIEEMSNETYRNVCHSIMAHHRAITYTNEINDFYHGICFIILGATVGALSSTLFWFYEYVILSTTQLLHLFFLIIQGQFMINKTDNIYNEICEGQWYNSVPRTQTLFVLALRSALDPPQITAGGLVAMNFETFAEVIKISFSYFTVLQTA